MRTGDAARLMACRHKRAGEIPCPDGSELSVKTDQKLPHPRQLRISKIRMISQLLLPPHPQPSLPKRFPRMPLPLPHPQPSLLPQKQDNKRMIQMILQLLPLPLLSQPQLLAVSSLMFLTSKLKLWFILCEREKCVTVPVIALQLSGRM